MGDVAIALVSVSVGAVLGAGLNYATLIALERRRRHDETRGIARALHAELVTALGRMRRARRRDQPFMLGGLTTEEWARQRVAFGGIVSPRVFAEVTAAYALVDTAVQFYVPGERRESLVSYERDALRDAEPVLRSALDLLHPLADLGPPSDMETILSAFAAEP